MKKITNFILLALIVVCNIVFTAKADESIYSAVVQLTNKNDIDRQLAIEKAMQMVCSKLSGKLVDLAVLKLNVPVSSYVKKYSYEEITENLFKIQVDFYKNSIVSFLTENNVYVLPEKRKALLVLGVSDSLQTKLMQQAKARALPILFPLLDLADQNIASHKDIAELNIPALSMLSAKYEAEHTLYLQMNENTQILKWYVLENTDEIWHSEGVDLDTSISKGFDELVDRLYRKKMKNNGVVVIKIMEISNLEQYGKVLQYLQALSIVEHVESDEIKPNMASFTLTLSGCENDLAIALANDDFFKNISNLHYKVKL